MKGFTWYLKQTFWIIRYWTRLRLQDMAKLRKHRYDQSFAERRKKNDTKSN